MAKKRKTSRRANGEGIIIQILDDGPDIIKPLSLVMMLASLRIGEALALKWENIDFEKGALFVEL